MNLRVACVCAVRLAVLCSQTSQPPIASRLRACPALSNVFITSALSSDALSFNVLAHWEVNTSTLPYMEHFLMRTIHDVTSINLQLDSQQTPLKRQRALDETGPSKSNLGSLAIRRRVA